MAANSRVFSSYRAIGYISNHVPLALQVRGADHFVTTVVGKTFHIYNCSKLNLLFVGEIQKEHIELLTAHGEYTVTASKNIITLWKRGKPVKHFSEHQFNIKCMLPFGEHIVSVDERSSVKIWDIDDLDVYLTLEFQSENFDITTALHPNTYLNKILFGSRQGKLQLWNVKTSTLIYEFNGWSEPVSVLEQAPAIDVAAIGLENGKIILHNLKYDETIVSFWQEFGPVTAISFRTDGNPVMATGSTAGHVSLWDLEKRQIHSIIHDCHHGNVSGMKFLQNQPLMITSGSDNTLKLWIFDNSDGSGRLHKYRTGHSEPPTRVRYYGKEGHVLLSAGLDRSLRYTSTIRDEQSCEISQGSLLKKSKNLGVRVEELKLSPITDLDAETTRASDWDNVVTCHSGSAYVRTWRLQNKSIGKHTLGKGLEGVKDRVATVARISSCGNFVVVGYSTGHMEIFNIQSGLHRGSFITIQQKAHVRPIRGIATDSANLYIISGAADGFLKFWGFKSRKMVAYEKFDSPIRQMVLQRDSSLLAVSLEDFSVKIIDIDTRKIVRNFLGHQHSITDMAFSPDARWLLTSSMDSSIRTWDLPSARLVDCFLVDSPITSLAFSPTGDFLATAHLEAIGIYLWSNKTLYTDAVLTPLPKDFTPKTIEMPTTVIPDEEEVEAIENNAEDVGSSKLTGDYQRPDQIGQNIVTLSLLPESRWRCLLDLQVIKERNKPKEPPKKPKAAPFFLPTVSGLNPKFDTSKDQDEQDDVPGALATNPFQEKTKFQKKLDAASEMKNYVEIMDLLKEMSPSTIDVEFRIASPLAGGSLTIVRQFLEFIHQGLKSGKDYELLQAYLGLFLKLHGKLVATEPSLREIAAEILETQTTSWNRCEELMNQSNCLINYFKNATL
eukprot:gene6767-7529_t